MHTERKAQTLSGWGMLVLVIAALSGGLFMLISSIVRDDVPTLINICIGSFLIYSKLSELPC